MRCVHKKKRKLFIITDLPFDQRQFERYQLKTLNKEFELKIVIFRNKNLRVKNYKFYHINNLYFFLKFFKNSEDILYIEILSNKIENLLVKLFFFIKGAKKILIIMGHYPNFNKDKNIIISFLKKILFYRKDSLLTILKDKMFSVLEKIYKSALIVSGGDEAKKIYINKTKKHFNFTSYDFFLFHKNKYKYSKNRNYILFLDSGLLGNSDFSLFSIHLSFDKKEYILKLNNFFSMLEKKYNTSIIISAHPKTNFKELKNNFKNFKIVLGKTEKLVAQSKFVIMHKSTAVSFVVLNKKPLLLITFDQIIDTWYGKEITNLKKLLGVPEININKFSLENNLDLRIKKNKYKKYIVNFIKSKNIVYQEYPRSICKAITNV
jgi:hypothetical protein